jgi:hypothetical protein
MDTKQIVVLGAGESGVGAAILAKEKGYDALVYENMSNVYDKSFSLWGKIKKNLLHIPSTITYKKYVDESIKFYCEHSEYVPCIMPNFDHSPRSSYRGRILSKDSPEEWGKLCKKTADIVRKRDLPFLFIKAWNEWGEGNYMEPDIKYGRGYIEALAKAIEESKK